MALKWPDKDPNAIKDYAIDWSAALLEGETIEESTWVASDPGLVIESDGAFAPSVADGVCTCWLSGGVAGQTCRVTNHIVTSRGMEDDKSADIKVKEQ